MEAEVSQDRRWSRNALKMLMTLVLVASIARLVIFILVYPYESDLPPMYADLEPYEDYKYLYLPEVKKFLGGEQLYKQFFHAYPPLWIYTLSTVARWDLPSWAPAIPTLVFDALAVVPTFMIAVKLTDERRAFLISLMSTLAPVVLWYDDVFWLNPPPSTFFMLVATWMMLSKRYDLSALLLGVASAYKQTSVVLLPFILVAVYRWASARRALRFTLIFTAVVFAASLPYVIEYPTVYLWALGFPGIPTPSPYAPEDPSTWKYDIVQPSNITTVFGVFGYPFISLLGRQYLLLAMAASFIFLTASALRNRRLDERNLVIYLLYSTLAFISFFPRGVYKYFFTASLPFLAALSHEREDFILFEIYNVGILLAPRFFTPWLALLILFLTPSLKMKSKSDTLLPIKDSAPAPGKS